MGKIAKVASVKLIIGFIFNNESIYDKAKAILEGRFGRVDFESAPIAFTYTDYYQDEMGQGLKRRFVSFSRLIVPSRLPDIKKITNLIEFRLSFNNKRRINIDPGYLDMAKLILASTKDFSHRIYLNKGIYAETTLIYQGRSFVMRDWTYPDYRTQGYIDIFNKIRQIYSQQTK
jgi:hypothetical protein